VATGDEDVPVTTATGKSGFQVEGLRTRSLERWPPRPEARTALQPRPCRRRWSELPRQNVNAALEVGDGEVRVDDLVETNDGIDVRNNGRTGRDRC
jgi:hypothetical protein